MLNVAIFLLAAAGEPADLDAVLRFRVPAECEMDEPLSTIVESMARIDPETYEAEPPPPISVPGFDAPIEPRFERVRRVEGVGDERTVTIDLDIPGRWHGLQVLRLHRVFVEESDSSSVEVHFAEPPQRVRTVLNRTGFRLRRVGEWREANSEFGMSVAVLPIEEGSALSCVIG